MMNTTKVIGGLIGAGAAVTHKLRKNPDNAEETIKSTTTVSSSSVSIVPFPASSYGPSTIIGETSLENGRPSQAQV